MASKDVGPGKEFFSDWHKERFIEDTERDLVAAQNRVAELEGTGADDVVLEAAKERVVNAKKELARFKPKAKAK